MNEYSLPGGAVSGAVRIGDTVHRQVGIRAGFVHELLGFFERAGWPGAPRFLGLDARGREIVSFVDGYVAWRPDASARASVTGEANLVRHRGRWRGDSVRAWCGRSRDFITNGVGFPLSLLASRISVVSLQHVVLCCHIQLIWSRGIYLAARWVRSGKCRGCSILSNSDSRDLL